MDSKSLDSIVAVLPNEARPVAKVVEAVCKFVAEQAGTTWA